MGVQMITFIEEHPILFFVISILGCLIIALISVIFEFIFPSYHALWDKIEGFIDGDYYTEPSYMHNRIKS